MLRRHLQRCVDTDIMASASVCLRRNAAVQRHASANGQHPVLPAAAASAVYSVLSSTKKLQCERNERRYKLGL